MRLYCTVEHCEKTNAYEEPTFLGGWGPRAQTFNASDLDFAAFIRVTMIFLLDTTWTHTTHTLYTYTTRTHSHVRVHTHAKKEIGRL